MPKYNVVAKSIITTTYEEVEIEADDMASAIEIAKDMAEDEETDSDSTNDDWSQSTAEIITEE